MWKFLQKKICQIWDYTIFLIFKKRKLNKCTDKTKKFSIGNKKIRAKVVRIKDGDTIEACFYFRGKLDKHTIRTEGYDTAEMHPPKNDPNREEIIKLANKAKDRLSELINDKIIVLLINPKPDKYGRVLAKLYSGMNDDKSINEIMIEEGHGKKYDGGTKEKFCVKI